MRQNKQITNKTIVLTAVIGSLAVLLMLTANTLWSSHKTGIATDDAISEVSVFYLEEMADRRARAISNLISSNFDHMEKAVDFIDAEGITSQDELRENLGVVKSLLGLNRFALVDEDDIVYTQYTTYMGRSRHAFLEEVKDNDRVISTVSVYGSSKQLCLAIPTPDLKLMGKDFKACFVQLDINEIVDLLAFDDQGKTNYVLYAQNGGNLSGTELGPIIKKDNFFDALCGIVSEEVLDENRKNFENGTDGSVTFYSGEAEETLCYVPIKETGWEMAVLIRESVIRDRIRNISQRNLITGRIQIVFTFVSVLTLAVVLLLQLRKYLKQMLEEEKETSRSFKHKANTDSLTGVRNKYAYIENEVTINEKIDRGEAEKLGIVICDINGLKYVNDTQGHAAGDRLIKDASKMICEYFKQGAVFRIGGDEFVVILQDNGFDSMMEVIEAFNKKTEENIKDNSVVVSIGYAVFEKQDMSLGDLFERADGMMYERKKNLKEMGAKTRE